MNIYYVHRGENWDYDEFGGFVCYAQTEEQARKMHPIECGECSTWLWKDSWVPEDKIHELNVEYLGFNPDITESKIIMTDFMAG